MKPPRLLTTDDIAELCNVAVPTVKSWRRSNTGPPWFALTPGCIRYDEAEVLTWLESRRSATGDDVLTKARRRRGSAA